MLLGCIGEDTLVSDDIGAIHLDRFHVAFPVSEKKMGYPAISYKAREMGKRKS